MSDPETDPTTSTPILAERRPPESTPGLSSPGSSHPTAADEVVDICRDLIRIDTSNYGDDSGPGERKAAEYVAGLLGEVGLDAELIESEPGRASVVVRWEGTDPTRPALVLHGHLDVVPAQAHDWQVDPFAGEIKDGYLWGRGAVDMKDMDAMMLATIREMIRSGARPPRDIIIGFFADEEASGIKGAHWLVDHRRDLFEGASEAVSEVGGYSIEVAGRRCYLLQTAEKGIRWLRLVAHGRAGHGSQVATDNAVTTLCAAVTRIGNHEWPIHYTPPVERFLDGISEVTGLTFDRDNPQLLLEQLGTTARWIGATLQNTANPTVLEAGYKHNVIPGQASALIDCRTLAGHEDELMRTIRELAGEGVDVEPVVEDIALDAPFGTPLTDAMVAALIAEDPGATVLPYCLSGGTDNKSMRLLGIDGYGFAPLRLPPDLDFSALFHGVDERVPLDALSFGTRVLRRFLDSC